MRSDEAPVVGIDQCVEHCVHPETVRHVRSVALPEDDLTQVASVFKLLGDPTRAKLLYAMLEAGELCVCDLAASTGVLEATVSQSLRLLRASKVVVARRDGRLMYYRLADAHVRMLLDLTREHITHEHEAGDAVSSAVRAAASGTAAATAPEVAGPDAVGTDRAASTSVMAPSDRRSSGAHARHGASVAVDPVNAGSRRIRSARPTAGAGA